MIGAYKERVQETRALFIITFVKKPQIVTLKLTVYSN